MTDTLFADVSSYQCGVNDSYPHRVFAFRSSDGTYRDNNFAHNYQWAVKAANAGKLDAFIVYYVWEDSGSDETHMDMINDQGGPHAKCVSMQDVESWGGKLSGDHSSAINASRENLISKLYHGNRQRVINYANQYDRQNLCPNYGDAKWIIANYSTNPNLKDQIAHQYADNVNCAPFGPCDANSADGVAPADFAKMLGVGGGTPAPQPEDDMPKQIYLTNKSGQVTKLATAGKWYTVGWNADLANTGGSSLSLPKGAGIFDMSAWLYTTGMGKDDNLYWRLQTLDGGHSNKELAKYPIGELRGTTGDTDFQFGQVGSVSSGTQTNLRILVASTANNVSITNAWWRCLYW